MIESPCDLRPLPDFDAPARAADAWMDAGMPLMQFKHSPVSRAELMAAIDRSNQALVDCGIQVAS